MCGRGECMARGGACVVGGMHGRGCAWQGGGHAWHMVNERAVRILRECILVILAFAANQLEKQSCTLMSTEKGT